MFVYINDTDRTSDIVKNSISIEDDIREKPNKVSFVLKGNKPTYFQDIRIFSGYEILSATATTVTLDAAYRFNENSLFRIDDTIYIAIGEADEETAVISSISNDSGNIKLTVSASFANTPATGEQCGKKEFAGSIVDINDRNIGTLLNIEYNIVCVDYTRIFDKRLINDTYADRDSRYIINSFCNEFINYNAVIDTMEYDDNTAIQAEWIETGDGNNPTLDTSSFREGDKSGIFSWTNAGGTATFTSSPTSQDISEFTGVNSGTPTKGVLGFWYKCGDYTDITNFVVCIGSDSSNYAEVSVTPTTNDWTFSDNLLKDSSITGTPDWTAMDYMAVVVTETGDDSVRFDGFRILEEEFFKHYPYVETSAIFDDFRIARVKPTEVLQRMADALGWFWYIDYDRYIHFFDQATNYSPFDIDEDSDDFDDLTLDYDTSRLINRQVVKGGDETSESFYSQVLVGDGVIREWILKNRFKNLTLKLDDNTSTDLMEGGTTTTNVTATGHGLVTGDYIVNRTQGNAVREITKVNDDNFTVEAVTGQGSGDTFSKFVEVNVGVEGINDEASYDFMSNFNEKSIRNADSQDTLDDGDFLLATYNEVIPILVQRSQNTSITNMKSVLGHTDGVFDGQPIIDRTIKSRSEANDLADATLNKYANVIITARFTTYKHGLKSGQVIRITDTSNGTRNLDQDFVIQQIRLNQVEWGYYKYTVTCSSILFGMLELLIQLLKQGRKLDINEDAQISNIEDAAEVILVTDSASVEAASEGDNKHTESILVTDSLNSAVFAPPFTWGVDPNQGTWNLCEWS